MACHAVAAGRRSVRAWVWLACLILATFFLGFGSWAALAPLSSAAVAPGAVRVESNRKTVQHLEGGIIEELRVREGDVVQADQVLIRLDRTQAAAHTRRCTTSTYLCGRRKPA